MRRRAFTLIELMVAMTIGAMMLMIAASMFSVGLKGRDRIGRQASDAATLRRTFETMSRDMHSAILPPDSSGVQFGLTTDPASTGSDALQLASTVGEPILAGRAANETVLVEYVVTDDPRDNVPTLFRYETAYPSSNGGTGGAGGLSSDTKPIPLVRGVVGVTYMFYDADQQNWLQSWDGQTGLPAAVRVDLLLQNPENKDPNVEPRQESWVFSLPSSKYINDQAAAAAGNTPDSGTGTSSTPGTGTGQ